MGAGVFGLSAALELHARGADVCVLEKGTVPDPLASSTDISKLIRMDYGADTFYTQLMEQALPRWEAWNSRQPSPLYHQTGFLLLKRSPLEPGCFEGDSLRLLRARGHALERLDAVRLGQRFPNWSGSPFCDGYYNPRAGWAASGEVVGWLAQQLRAAGATLREGVRCAGLLEEGGRVRGVTLASGEQVEAERVLLAVGAWTPKLLPELSDRMWPVAQDVFHFRPADPEAFSAELFPPWAADIGRSGWYGFCALADGTLKVARHGIGRRVDPDAVRAIASGREATMRAFFSECLPRLVGAQKLHERVCLYCDTFDGDFWLAEHPQRPGLFVMAGGSGHGFKFAPVLGEIAADVLEGRANPWAARFAWRSAGGRRGEDARCLDAG